jgi:hypothetical protein
MSMTAVGALVDEAQEKNPSGAGGAAPGAVVATPFARQERKGMTDTV